LYEGLAKLLKALSNPIRLEIIEMLSQGEKSLEGVVKAYRVYINPGSQLKFGICPFQNNPPS